MILLDPSGHVAEYTGENLFVVRKNVIAATQTAPVLEGITRHALITLAGDLGYRVVEGPISRDQLYTADEVFVCGTAAECVAVGLRAGRLQARANMSGRLGRFPSPAPHRTGLADFRHPAPQKRD